MLITGFILACIIIGVEVFPGQGTLGHDKGRPIPVISGVRCIREHRSNTGRFRSTIIIVAFAYGNVHNGGGNPQLTSMPRASKRIVMLRAFFAGSNR